MTGELVLFWSVDHSQRLLCAEEKSRAAVNAQNDGDADEVGVNARASSSTCDLLFEVAL